MFDKKNLFGVSKKNTNKVGNTTREQYEILRVTRDKIQKFKYREQTKKNLITRIPGNVRGSKRKNESVVATFSIRKLIRDIQINVHVWKRNKNKTSSKEHKEFANVFFLL